MAAFPSPNDSPSNTLENKFYNEGVQGLAKQQANATRIKSAYYKPEQLIPKSAKYRRNISKRGELELLY